MKVLKIVFKKTSSLNQNKVLSLYHFCFSYNKNKFTILIDTKKMVLILLIIAIAKSRFSIYSTRLKLTNYLTILLLLIYYN